MFSSTLGGWFRRLFILPHMIVGLCLIIYPFLLGARSFYGVEVPATVADRIKYRDSEGARCYKVEVEYDYAGTQYSEDIGLNREQYSQYRKGDEVFVRFLPAARRPPRRCVDRAMLMKAFPYLLWRSICFSPHSGTAL
ncbi:MAG: DUF3592 domain-containing protein [Cyanobacteriota/Melainabacteria group bacterium]